MEIARSYSPEAACPVFFTYIFTEKFCPDCGWLGFTSTAEIVRSAAILFEGGWTAVDGDNVRVSGKLDGGALWPQVQLVKIKVAAKRRVIGILAHIL
jgi:hypothetical protein